MQLLTNMSILYIEFEQHVNLYSVLFTMCKCVMSQSINAFVITTSHSYAFTDL
jgi:hypothetical protein